MALQVSSGFKAKILGPSAFEDIFNGGVIRVFSGVQPVNANVAQAGTLLGTITLDGAPWIAGTGTNGLAFARTAGVIVNDPMRRWRLTPIASGTAAWWRLIERAGDSGSASLTSPRIDGSVAVYGGGTTAEMYLDDVALTVGVVRSVTSFFYTIPPL